MEDLKIKFLDQLESLPEGAQELILCKANSWIKRALIQNPWKKEPPPKLWEECLKLEGQIRHEGFPLQERGKRISLAIATKLQEHLAQGEIMPVALVIASMRFPTYSLPEWSSLLLQVRAAVKEDPLLYPHMEERLRCLWGYFCAECGIEGREDYMVKNSIWNESGSKRGEVLHLRCLEKRLGRLLTVEDFTEVPCNSLIFWAFERGHT